MHDIRCLSIGGRANHIPVLRTKLSTTFDFLCDYSFESNVNLMLTQELTRMRERATALLAYKALLPVRFSVDASRALQDIERELLAG